MQTSHFATLFIASEHTLICLLLQLCLSEKIDKSKTVYVCFYVDIFRLL